MTAISPEPGDLTPSSAFQLQSSDVVLEAFPDETIAVHLGTGRYYSLDLMAAEMLDLLVSGRELVAVVEHLAARYHAEPAEVEPAITELATRLLDEGLVTRAPGAAPRTAFPAPTPAEAAFAAPTLMVYSDMEDLLLLDPVHDVDDTGWPVRADPAELAPAESQEE